MLEPHRRDSLRPRAGEEGGGVPPLKVVAALVGVEVEGGRRCALAEELLVGPPKAQQGGLGKENLGRSVMGKKASH